MYGLGYVSLFNKLEHTFGGAIGALVCAPQITECRWGELVFDTTLLDYLYLLLE